MAIDSHYIAAFSIETVILDKDTGAPLSGGLVYFEQDNQPGILKPVYQITGTSPNYSYAELPNPMVLSSIGTFEDSLSNPVIPYFFPYDGSFKPEYYQIRVTSADGVPQFTRYSVPYIANGGSDLVSSIISNELSNPQFSEVFFSGTHVFNFSAASSEVVNIAPDWDIIVTSSGVGTVTLTQGTPTGASNLPTNPGTFLTIASAGITTLLLRQRIYGSPNLWGSGNLSGSFVARTYSNTSTPLNMYYSQSSGIVLDKQIVTATLPASGAYGSYSGSVVIPGSSSLQTYPDAYIDIYLNIPTNIQIDLTSLMVAFTGTAVITDIVYDQESNERQIDHLFHYYKTGLDFKPIPSLLVGWDFPLNPFQFNVGVNAPSFDNTSPVYVCDQTICRSSTGTVLVGQATSGVLQFTTQVANEAFYMLQYLSDGNAIQATLADLSTNLVVTASQSNVTATVQLFYTTAGGSIPLFPTTIGTIAFTGGKGVFTLTEANWSEILQPKGQTNTATVSNSVSSIYLDRDISFYGYDARKFNALSSNNAFAIVITFTAPTSGTYIFVESASCVPGNVPTRPAPQAKSEVLRECQYYYETSYPPGIAPGTVSTFSNAYTAQMNSLSQVGNTYVYATPFSLNFAQAKRVYNSGLSVFSPDTGAVGYFNVQLFTTTGVIVEVHPDALAGTYYSVTEGYQRYSFVPISNGALASRATTQSPGDYFSSGAVRFHYVADARLGKI